MDLTRAAISIMIKRGADVNVVETDDGKLWLEYPATKVRLIGPEAPKADLTTE